MGKLFKSKFKTPVEVVGGIIGVVLLSGALYLGADYIPGFKVKDSIKTNVIDLNTEYINNLEEGDELALPSKTKSTKVSNQPLFRVSGYPWNGQTGMMGASGGKETKAGSLMELNNVNFAFTRRDGVSDLSNSIVNFAIEFDKGANQPQSDMSSQGIIIMGDGAPFFLATTQKLLNEKFGDKYHVQIVGGIGMSYGEDGLIAPMNWKGNPQEMVGKVISVVYGDGNWVVMLNYCAANNLPVNPDHTTYDPNAVNLYPSENDDFIKSAEELIKSVTSGYQVELDEIQDGRRTGKKVKRSIDAMASWTPADKMVFDKLKGKGFTKIISTKEFNNQMPTTLIVLKEWADKNPAIITNFLKSVYTATNQIKLYDSWLKRSTEANAESFAMENGEYWYKLFKGQEGIENGVPYQVGGSRVLNLADAKQYYGLGIDGISRYKSVYDQVSIYLKEFKPFGFKDAIPSYDEAVNLSYIQNVQIGNSSGAVVEKDYNSVATDVVASGSWRFNFGVGSANILSSSNDDLNKLYNILIQAEDTKVTIVGHTDNTGSNEINKPLSKQRAESVKTWLVNKGINPKRIQLVEGVGSDQPIADNNTAIGKSQNRRTDVTLLK